MTLRRFIVERDIAKVGTFERDQLRGAAQKSNEVLRQLGPDIQWIESFVAGDKTFCVYMTKDEVIINKHAELSVLPGDEDHGSAQDDRPHNRQRLTNDPFAVRVGFEVPSR